MLSNDIYQGRILVGYEWHEFVGDGMLCGGTIGGGPDYGKLCHKGRNADIHSPDRKPEWIKGLDSSGQPMVPGEQKVATFDESGNLQILSSAYSTQIGGDHYKKYKIQPLEYIVTNRINFLEGNIIKYVTRWRDKGGVEDLLKARHYLDVLIEEESKIGT